MNKEFKKIPGFSEPTKKQAIIKLKALKVKRLAILKRIGALLII